MNHYIDGMFTYLNGGDGSDNPFYPHQVNWRIWVAGYMDAMYEQFRK